jgi:tripartite-type tricarboxylate transporter receptor subunit TctC
MPDVPTAKEAGVENYEFYLWFMLLAPGGTPRPVVDRLNAAWTKVSALPEVQAAIAKTGCTTLKSTPEQAAKFFEAEVARWAKIIQEASIPRQ